MTTQIRYFIFDDETADIEETTEFDMLNQNTNILRN